MTSEIIIPPRVRRLRDEEKRRLIEVDAAHTADMKPNELFYLHDRDQSASGDWVDCQAIFPPRMQRIPDWREELERRFDAWSCLPYESSKTCCFAFAADCIDAMCGTNIRQMHYGGWKGAARFGKYIEGKGGLDWFDRVGTRIEDRDAEAGDLIQVEIVTRQPNGKKTLQFHWAISTGVKYEGVCFFANGVGPLNAFEAIWANGGTIKTWAIARELNGPNAPEPHQRRDRRGNCSFLSPEKIRGVS